MVHTDDFLDVDGKCLGEQKYSFDMGGTLAKLVYIDENANLEARKRRIRFKIFSSNEPEKLVEYVNKIFPSRTDQPPQTLHVTGVCAMKHKPMLEERLHVRLQILNELDTFSTAMVVLLSTCTPRDVFKPPSMSAEGNAMKNVMEWAEIMQKLTLGNADDQPPEQENKEKDDAITPEASTPKEQVQDTKQNDTQNNTGNEAVPETAGAEAVTTVLPVNRNMYNEEAVPLLPCLHVMVGSATGYMKVDENGKTTILNGGPTGGKYFMGLARLATGVKDFNEMVNLAEKGILRNVDLFGSDTKDELRNSDNSGFYTSFPDDQMLYGLGKVTLTDEKLRKEDILASLFHYLTNETINMSKNIVQQYGLKRIYFTGGFLQHEFVKSLAEEYMAMMLTSFQIDNEIKYGFIEHGNMYGALGCLLKTDN